MKIAAICAPPPRLNAGMATVDEALEQLLAKHPDVSLSCYRISQVEGFAFTGEAR